MTQTADPGNRLDLPDWLSKALLSPVTLFQLYRFFLALMMLTAYFTNTGPATLGQTHPALFAISSIIYLGFVVAGLLTLQFKKVRDDTSINLMTFTDIVLLTLMMHASGGVESGLGILLAISVTAGSLMMRGRLALLFAALASLAVMTEQLAIVITPDGAQTDFVQSALLGIAFFAIALLSHSLSLHIRASENLAMRKQQDLADMAQLSEYIIDHMQQGVIAIDNNRQIRLVNQSALKLLALPESKPSKSLPILCPELGRQLDSWLKNKQALTKSSIKISNSSKELRTSFTPLGRDNNAGTLIFLEDASEITHQAQQLKLASIGRLTASIAHEIRNPLGAISHAGQLLSESPMLASEDHRLTEIIRNNSSRVNEVIESILSLSRRDSAKPQLVRVKSWLNDFRSKFLQISSLDPTQLILDVAPADIQASFDPVQVEQVLFILANNSVSHFDRRLAQLDLRILASLDTGHGNLLLEFSDNGPGISEGNRRQIFEPFFTTSNAGTGLGLYIARELSESNRARIEYLPSEQRGSHFRISFVDPIDLKESHETG
ncbi:MAG: ATP-binding protein [Chromatiales bacterium]|jgi:two-component system sensor histidine kinase PilS (NtrC family)